MRRAAALLAFVATEVASFAVGLVALFGIGLLALAVLAAAVVGFTVHVAREEAAYLVGRIRGRRTRTGER